MGLLKDSDREQLQKEFERLTQPVKLMFFTQALDCDYCPLTQQVLEELVGLSDKIQLQIYNFAIDKDQVFEHKIARVPAIGVVRVETQMVDGKEQTRDHDYGIHYYGVPSGFEFGSLVSDILDVSRGESGLSEQSRTQLKQLTEPLHLQVFTTPTWPHCPRAVSLAHKMAMENELITADMVDASEYPDLADYYQVYGVPLTVANGKVRIEGGMPEPMFIPRILQGIGIKVDSPFAQSN